MDNDCDAKGRIFEEAATLLRKANYPLPDDFSFGRKLIVEAPEAGMKFFLAKPMDVATYVEHGVATLVLLVKMFLWKNNEMSMKCLI